MVEQEKKKWFVVQVASGFEAQIPQKILESAKREGLDESFGEILVPTESLLTLRAGKRHKTTRKFFPGYVLVQMVLNDNTWHLVRTTPKVFGFIGGKSERPIPLREREIEEIFAKLKTSNEVPKYRLTFEIGEEVRICEGPFSDFKGTVEKIDYEKNKLNVLVSILGRLTPVELTFQDVQKED